MPLSLKRLLAGDPLSTARAISLVENRQPGAEALLRRVASRTGGAHRIGIAGPPGAGKSTLVAGLIRELRARRKSVGILATDPSSTLTGGAILGDRVRIQEPGEDTQVFYRSMATRGWRGGLSRACRDTIRILEASGKDVVLVETVGVGQAEIDITTIVDTLILVLVPESGDFIQMLKAGILEFGDVLVVNKSDRPGADEVVEDLKDVVSLRGPRLPDSWTVPVLKTVAKDGTGIAAVLDAATAHRRALAEGGLLAERRRVQALAELRERLLDGFREKADKILAGPQARSIAARLGEGKIDGAAAAGALGGNGRPHGAGASRKTRKKR